MSSPLSSRTLQEEAIARAVAAGTPTDQITAFFDITPAALTALTKQHGFQATVTQFQEKQRMGMTMTQAYLAQLLPGAWQKVAAALEGPDNKQALDAAWRVINKYVPDASIQKGDLTVNANMVVSNESIQQVAAGLRGLLEARQRGTSSPIDLDDDPHFHQA